MTPEELDGLRCLLAVAPNSIDLEEAAKMLLTHIDRQGAQISALKDALLLKTCEKIYWSLHGSGSPEEKSTPVQYADEAREQLKMLPG